MFISEGLSAVIGTISRLAVSFGVSFFLHCVAELHLVHLLAHFHQMYRNMRGFAICVLMIAIMIISPLVNDLYSLSISSNLFMKLTIGTPAISDKLLRQTFDFACVRLGTLKSDINLNRSSDN